MLKVALTGNVGSGKTTVTRIWSEAGVPVIRADDLARDVVVPGSDGLARIVQEFGDDVLQADGSLHRTYLRERVFRDSEDRTRLERILHPLIQSLRDDWVTHHEQAGTPLIVAEIPLLFEAGLQKEYDVIVLVVAPRNERIRRLVSHRGLNEEEASRVMAAQISTEEKVPLADYVLENSGSREDLGVRCLALLDLLQARARWRKNQ